jgi:uncharacterized protein YbbC (DUF1343 family)
VDNMGLLRAHRGIIQRMHVQLGCERLLASSSLDGLSVGVVCNPASVDSELRHVADLFAEHRTARLAALFGPQHGFRSDVQDNMIETGHGQDCTRKVPVYSLYSETREPTAAMLAGLDRLVIDLQDVGSRIYTFIYTMANCLIAAGKHGVKAIVCDRPNPIGGADVEGPMLVRGYESFVGQYPIPMRHGMTIGELALLFNSEFGIGADLEVVRMDGWRREMYFDVTGLPWVIPSPNMPTLDTAIVYPGMCLIEGTNLSEGRGTTRPFELCGAPFVDGRRLASELERSDLPGVRFRACAVEPAFHKFARQRCGAVQLHVTDRQAFNAYRTGLAVLVAVKTLWPDAFAWRAEPYEFRADVPAIDLLTGLPAVREAIDRGADVEAVVQIACTGTERYAAGRDAALLYD